MKTKIVTALIAAGILLASISIAHASQSDGASMADIKRIDKLLGIENVEILVFYDDGIDILTTDCTYWYRLPERELVREDGKIIYIHEELIWD